MKSLSLAHVKAHLSEVVDDAEHRGQRVVILRHGKPAAAIVPLAVVRPTPRVGRRRTVAEIDAWLTSVIENGLGTAGGRWDDPAYSAVEDLIQGRR